MKRIALSFGLPVLGLLLGVAAPATASAQGWHGGHAAVHASGGWRGTAVTRPVAVPHVAVGARTYVGRPAYGPHPGYAVHPGYAGRPYHYGLGPVAGHWGLAGGRNVWFGVATLSPYSGWLWTPGTWVWDGTSWVWQDGYWAPPAY